MWTVRMFETILRLNIKDDSIVLSDVRRSSVVEPHIMQRFSPRIMRKYFWNSVVAAARHRRRYTVIVSSQAPVLVPLLPRFLKYRIEKFRSRSSMLDVFEMQGQSLLCAHRWWLSAFQFIGVESVLCFASVKWLDISTRCCYRENSSIFTETNRVYKVTGMCCGSSKRCETSSYRFGEC